MLPFFWSKPCYDTLNYLLKHQENEISQFFKDKQIMVCFTLFYFVMRVSTYFTCNTVELLSVVIVVVSPKRGNLKNIRLTFFKLGKCKSVLWLKRLKKELSPGRFAVFEG